MKRALAGLVVVLIAAALVACVATGDEATAKKLIAAVEQYQKDTGRYPEALEALVPKYVATRPETVYFYRLEGDAFVLSYTSGFKVSMNYHSRSREWYRID